MSLSSKMAIRNTALACLVITSGSHAETSTPTVFKFLPDDVLPEAVLYEWLSERQVANYRVVTVDADALRQLLRDASPTDSDRLAVSLPLVDQSLISIEIISGGEWHDGWRSGFASLLGKIAGDELSTVQCVIAPDGSMSLVIRGAGKRYKVDKTPLLPYHIYWEQGEGSGQKID